jgi:NAD(P)-dependent dehydrogenase (short-subunit alcohol dehydrogenase family)
MNEKKVALLSATRSGMGSDAAKKLASKGFNVSILSPSEKEKAYITGQNDHADGGVTKSV